MNYAETHSTDPYYNLAFEEYILYHRRSEDWLLLWQNANTIVVGLNQNTAGEINASFVEEHGIRVVRRNTGGGAVYHDMGNLNYSFIMDAGDLGQLSMGRFTKSVCDALAEMGVEAEASGRNDITIQGKKVSGTAQRVHQGRILHHGTLLFQSDPQKIAGALRVDPEKFVSKGTKSVQGRVGNIADFLPEKLSIDAFKANLRKALTADRFTPVRLATWELEEVKRIADTKYRTWAWNYGASPPFRAVRKRARFDGGSLEIWVEVQQGLIKSIRFLGDFMARAPLDTLEEALVGCRFAQSEVSTALAAFPLADLFGGIQEGEILDILFSEE